VLALRGGADLVALWAQLVSLIEIVSGVALAGLGTGLAVLVARTRNPERQHELLREALEVGLALALPAALVVGGIGFFYGEVLSGAQVAPALFFGAAAVGWIGVIAGLVSSLWLGQQRRALQLAFAVGCALLALAAASLAPSALLLPALLAAQALPAVVAWFIPGPAKSKARLHWRAHALRRYALPSVVIGVLSPASTLVARAAVGDALSWHDAGILQALWRLSDWVCGFASGVLSVHFLPQLAAARQRADFRAVLAAATRWTLLPAAAVFILFFAFAEPLLALLYTGDFRPSALATALIFAGGLVRIGAWIGMFGLYARRRTYALAIGELLSLPLFAALVVALGSRLTLELAGACWLAAYCAYLAFNAWALRRG
jgi:polysaccharide transporter, PST family